MAEPLRRLRGAGTAALSLAPYVLIPAVSAAAPLLVIPAISARFGAATWTSIAIAQSLGGAASVVAELGWGVSGPQRVASTSPTRRWVLYRAATASKILAVLGLAPLVVIATLLLAPAARTDAVLVALGTTLYALSTNWYFVGSGRPRFILYSDSLPRVLLTMLCAIAIFAGGPLWLYSWSTVLLPAGLVVISTALLGRAFIPSARDLRRAPRAIRQQGVLAAGRAVSTIYTALPVSIVAAAAPSAVTLYAGSERLMRMGLTFLAAFPNRLQSWIGSAPTRAERFERSRRAIAYNALLGGVSGSGFALLAPLAAEILFAGTIRIPFLLSGLSGLLLAIICTSRGFGLAVVAHRRANTITVAILFAAATGLGLLAPLSRTFGPFGAVIAIVLAELVGLGVQAYYLRRAGALDANAST